MTGITRLSRAPHGRCVLRRSSAGALLAAAALLGGCTQQPAPAPTPVTSTVDPEANVGHVIATGSTGTTDPWVLSTSKDENGRLCMNVVLRPDNVNLAETCGLPNEVGNGYVLASARGMKQSVFYFAPVPASVTKVTLTFASGGSETVPTRVAPAQVKAFSRFFLLERPHGPAAAATVTYQGATAR